MRLCSERERARPLKRVKCHRGISVGSVSAQLSTIVALQIRHFSHVLREFALIDFLHFHRFTNAKRMSSAIISIFEKYSQSQFAITTSVSMKIIQFFFRRHLRTAALFQRVYSLRIAQALSLQLLIQVSSGEHTDTAHKHRSTSIYRNSCATDPFVATLLKEKQPAQPLYCSVLLAATH